MGQGAYGFTEHDSPLTLYEFEYQPHSVAQPNVGSWPWDSDRRGLILDTRHDEAVIVSW